MNKKHPHISLLLTDSGEGGVERMLINTASGLAGMGFKVSLIAATREVRYLDDLSADTEVITLPDRRLVPALERYMRHSSVTHAISGKLKDDALLAAAKDSGGLSTQIYFRVGNPLGHRASARARNRFGRWLKIQRLRRLYRKPDGCIAVSKGIRDDLIASLGVPAEKVHVLPNPVVADSLYSKSRLPLEHPWFPALETPLIVGVGGLRRQKGFLFLLEAFSLLRSQRPCRLLIVGEGHQRRRLLTKAEELGVSEDVDLAGWLENPYPYMRGATVFALSSEWEGFGNVIVEACALGTPVVATDCPVGPREILGKTDAGRLVPFGDVHGFSQALNEIIERPPDLGEIKKLAEPYRLEESAAKYADALRLL